MRRRRKLYVPITRSMPSIFASLLTQLIQEHRKELNAKILDQFNRGEISGPHAYFLIHPIFCTFVLMFLLFLLAYLLGCVSLSDATFLGGVLVHSYTTMFGRKS